ncbi:hypothetical protein HF086_009994 [Spodoptera exigua]|uniref:EF-hand domain-containing protein n=1 Tax=Spodoptera exigua TaxID=7107 RepID=A0A922MSA5_SPOEX|nr:hypothetical protein HF086_009994 [Spodoptera exigua]
MSQSAASCVRAAAMHNAVNDLDLSVSNLLHTKPACNGSVCYLGDLPRDRDLRSDRGSALRRYSKHHGRPEEDRRKQSDSDSDSDSDTECKGYDRSEFWRRKMRTVHNILDVDKDGLISFNDFILFAERFKSLGHLTNQQAEEFTSIIKDGKLSQKEFVKLGKEFFCTEDEKRVSKMFWGPLIN